MEKQRLSILLIWGIKMLFTIDDGLSAQIEYIALITEDGVEVLTK